MSTLKKDSRAADEISTAPTPLHAPSVDPSNVPSDARIDGPLNEHSPEPPAKAAEPTDSKSSDRSTVGPILRPSQDAKKPNYVAGILVLLCLVAALGYAISSAREKASKERQTASAGDQTIDQTIDQVQLQTVGVMEIAPSATAYIRHRYTATVVPRRTSQLSFQSAERVVEILVDEGDPVESGQLVARQDDTALAALAAAATAKRHQSQATLDELMQGPRQETIDAARSELAQLRAQVDLASVTLNRQRELRKSRASSAQEYDTARFDRAATMAAVNAATSRLAELEAGTRIEQIAAQKANVAVARAAEKQAKIRLSQAKIFAPFAGTVAARFIDEGNLVQQGTPVLEIIESRALEVRFGASTMVAARLQPDDVIPFTSQGQTYRGTISQINPRLDATTRTRAVVVNVSPEDARAVVAGQTVSIQFALPSKEPGFWLPSESLLPQVRGLWSVMVLENADEVANGKLPTASVARRDVEVLSTWGTWSRVRGTIEAGDQVIVQGASRIAPGQKINFKTIVQERPWNENAAKILAGNPTSPVNEMMKSAADPKVQVLK